MTILEPKTKVTLEDLQALTLHQRITLGDVTDVLRVPGGWVYRTFKGSLGGDIVTSTFVPEKW